MKIEISPMDLKVLLPLFKSREARNFAIARYDLPALERLVAAIEATQDDPSKVDT